MATIQSVRPAMSRSKPSAPITRYAVPADGAERPISFGLFPVSTITTLAPRFGRASASATFSAGERYMGAVASRHMRSEPHMPDVHLRAPERGHERCARFGIEVPPRPLHGPAALFYFLGWTSRAGSGCRSGRAHLRGR